eukprot:14737_1
MLCRFVHTTAAQPKRFPSVTMPSLLHKLMLVVALSAPFAFAAQQVEPVQPASTTPTGKDKALKLKLTLFRNNQKTLQKVKLTNMPGASRNIWFHKSEFDLTGLSAPTESDPNLILFLNYY